MIIHPDLVNAIHIITFNFCKISIVFAHFFDIVIKIIDTIEN